MLVGCGVCGDRIIVLSPPSDRFVDPKDGREYSMEHLPRHDDGTVILVCVGCLRSGITVLEAGHALDVDFLRVAKVLLAAHECEADENLGLDEVTRVRERRLVEFYEQVVRNATRMKPGAGH